MFRFLNERRMLRSWPKVRQTKDGLRVQGRCLTARTWALTRRATCLLSVTLGLYLLAAATIALWGPRAYGAANGTSWYQAVNGVMSVRWHANEFLTERYPALGRAFLYTGRNPVDWHMGVVALLLTLGRIKVARLTAPLFTILFRPLLTKKFRILIANDRVRIGGWLTGRSFARDDNGPEPVRFRAVSAEERYSRFRAEEIRDKPLFRPLMHHPPAAVEMTHGFKRYTVVFCRRTDHAEAIVTQCNEAMLRTRPMMHNLTS